MTLPRPPAELSRFSEHLSPDELYRLVQAFGGQRLYLPRGINQAHGLARTLGLDAARRLAEGIGAGQISIPLARHWQILVLRSRGLTHRAIAAELRITEKAVEENLRAARRHSVSPQLDLFG
jgi:DNA-binding NarL/FixJ family response regulator